MYLRVLARYWNFPSEIAKGKGWTVNKTTIRVDIDASDIYQTTLKSLQIKRSESSPDLDRIIPRNTG